MPQLVYRDAVGATQSFSLEGRRSATIGRGSERELVLEGRQVSRRHASIERVSSSYLLRDLGSANGTFLNGLRLSGTSAIALRDGDVIEVGAHRLLFSAGLGQARLEPPPREPSTHVETTYAHADVLRDGVAWVREHEGEPDDASSEVLVAFDGRSFLAGLGATLEILVRRLAADGAAAFVRRRGTGALELVAARPDAGCGRSIAATFDVAASPGVVRLYHRASEGGGGAPSLTETCDVLPEHSAALVPFYWGPSLLGILAVERLGPRIDRQYAAIIAVYGERIARALSRRLASQSDTAFDVALSEGACE